jgi:hypothetical protein
MSVVPRDHFVNARRNFWTFLLTRLRSDGMLPASHKS